MRPRYRTSEINQD